MRFSFLSISALAFSHIAILTSGCASPTGDAIMPVSSEIAAGNLRGTLLDAGARKPVAIIVPGSGPTNRDGDTAVGKSGSYRLLAEALGDKGISTIRVDKRGMFGSAGAGDPNGVTRQMYADDIRAWIDVAKAKTGQSCIWLMGHSEGALMVSTAAEGRKDVCGLVLIAGPGRPLGAVLREQLTANPANAPLLPQAMAAMDTLEAGGVVDDTTLHPALKPLFASQVQDYLRSAVKTDPVAVLTAANVRALIVQGTHDIQISEADARRLASAPGATLALIDGMNHVLKTAPLDRAGNMATYANPDLPLAPGVADTIAAFIREGR